MTDGISNIKKNLNQINELINKSFGAFKQKSLLIMCDH